MEEVIPLFLGYPDGLVRVESGMAMESCTSAAAAALPAQGRCCGQV